MSVDARARRMIAALEKRVSEQSVLLHDLRVRLSRMEALEGWKRPSEATY